MCFATANMKFDRHPPQKNGFLLIFSPLYHAAFDDFCTSQIIPTIQRLCTFYTFRRYFEVLCLMINYNLCIIFDVLLTGKQIK